MDRQLIGQTYEDAGISLIWSCPSAGSETYSQNIILAFIFPDFDLLLGVPVCSHSAATRMAFSHEATSLAIVFATTLDRGWYF